MVFLCPNLLALHESWQHTMHFLSAKVAIVCL